MSGCFSFTFDMDDLNVLCEGYGLKDEHVSVIYEKVIPRMLEFLDDEEINGTFFVIAERGTEELARSRLKEIADKGHEIANHSLNHKHYLGMSYEQTYDDLRRSTNILTEITGVAPTGFRGPSLTFNEHTPKILEDLGYEYDSSIHPTPLFLGEWLYLTLNCPSKRNRPDMFFVKHAMARRAPYIASDCNFFKPSIEGRIVEFPISVASFLRIPFYPTFHFMFKVAYKLTERFYFSAQNLVFLAHALDFIDFEKDDLPPGFKKHPGVSIPWKIKKEYFRSVIKSSLKHNKRIVTLKEQAKLFKG